MKVILEKIVLWRRDVAECQPYTFEPGCVNVISGVKQSGRTAFVNIVDYVLGADECDLPSVFLPAVGWVGIVFTLGGMRHLLARCVPDAAKRSSGAYMVLSAPADETLDIPPVIDTNRTAADVIKWLDKLVCGTFEEIKRQGVVVPRLTFRDVFNFNLQDDSTITNRHALVHGMENGPTATKLREYFPFLAGIQTRDCVNLIGRIESKEDELKEQTRIRTRIAEVTAEWSSELRDKLFRAQELGLYDPNKRIPEASNPDGLVYTAREILEVNKNYQPPQLRVEALDQRTAEAAKCQQEMEQLVLQSQKVQMEIRRLNGLKDRVDDMRRTSEKTKERLEISEWVDCFWRQDRFFGFGGEGGADTVNTRLKLLKQALERYAASATNPERYDEFLEVYDRELQEWKDKRRTIAERHRAAAEHLSRLNAEKGVAQEFIASQKKAFELLGEIRSAVALTEKLNSAEVSLEGLQGLKNEIDMLKLELKNVQANEKNKLESCAYFLSKRIMDRLDKLYVSDDIKASTPHFNCTRLTVQFSEHGKQRDFSTVGASTNYLCIHIAVASALMELFAQREDSPVANFVLFDCPALGEVGAGATEGVSRREATVLVDVLKKSVAESPNSWQPILLVPADEPVVADDPKNGVHLVAHFGPNQGIIPDTWL